MEWERLDFGTNRAAEAKIQQLGQFCSLSRWKSGKSILMVAMNISDTTRFLRSGLLGAERDSTSEMNRKDNHGWRDGPVWNMV